METSLEPGYALPPQIGSRCYGPSNIPVGYVNGCNQGGNFEAYAATPGIDIATLHYYGEAMGVEAWNATAFAHYFIADRAQIAFRWAPYSVPALHCTGRRAAPASFSSMQQPVPPFPDCRL